MPPTATLTQLDATPTTWLASSYDLRGGTGGTGRLRFRWREEEGRLDVGGRRYRFLRQDSGGVYILERRGRTIATAVKPAEFSRSFEIDHRGDRFVLSARPMRRAFKILHRGRRVAEVGPAAWYKRHARLSAHQGIDEELGYFLMVLVLLWWRRRRIA